MSNVPLSSAIEDFHRARRKAALRQIIGRFTGEPVHLLSYEEVLKQLKARNASDIGLQEVPLTAIIGSVNRYNDFTRDFLPLDKVRPDRWAQIEVENSGASGLPPVELYKIGEAYFVKDGNHRVSVARQLGATLIQAYVTQVNTRVPLTPDVQPEDLILKAEYANFLETTHLDEIRPKSDLSVSEPGQYPKLEEHIEVHRYYMGLEQQRFISYEEAVANWYDTVYQPVAEVIENEGILREFPGRTVADLYLWIADHRAALETEVNRDIDSSDAARDLADQYSQRPGRVVSRLTDKLKNVLLPNALDGGPPTGQWRKEHWVGQSQEHIFRDILVPVNGQSVSWPAVQEAILIARREESRLQGLHIVPTEADKESPEAQAVEAEFNRLCQEAGVHGSLVLTVGEVSNKICERSRWSDLLAIKLNYPPPPQPLKALTSGFRSVLQRCPQPTIVIPSEASSLSKGLLAYDQSPRAKEALYMATYLATAWNIHLSVISVDENGLSTEEALQEASDYLEVHGVRATLIAGQGPQAESILKTARDEGCDFLLMGGYGLNPVLNVVLGSTVNFILNLSTIPIFICR